MRARFLVDENSWRDALINGLKARNPEIDILHVGDSNAPSHQTHDPDILLYCERERRMLITRDWRTMPVHIRNHFASAHHHWGVLYLRPGHTIGEYLTYLELLWSASEAEEHADIERFIP
ncbi:MAG TPA: DUF5615 family PIN-like protein [Ktedonobacterales bacterium]|nr:DUF5615 family PIN-like protein [Ktedonobacterales bacterium]